MEVGNQHHSPVTLPGGKKNNPCYPWSRSLGECQCWSGWFGEEKNLLPMLGFSPKTAQRSHYTNYTISTREEISLYVIIIEDVFFFHQW